MSATPVDDVVNAHGLRFHYRHWTPTETPPKQPPILLIHGLASAAHIWDIVAPLLAAQGYAVTALDQRGHGESDKPNSGYDFATIVEDDTEIVQALHLQRPAIVGHSWGASVALQFAATHPDMVTSLVLVDGGTNQLSLRSGWTREKAMQELAPPRFAGTPRETFLGWIRSSPLGQQWSPQLEDIMLHIVQVRDDDTVAPRLDFDNHLQIVGSMWDQPTFDLYQQVRCPITIVVAEQEPADEPQRVMMQSRNEGLERIHRLRPDATIIRMPNTIHDIPLQRPRELAALIMQHIAPSPTT